MDNKENDRTAYNLFNYRQKAGITQQEAADFLGVSRQTVSKWEAGKSAPDGVYLKGICELYHISPNEFFEMGECTNEIVEQQNGENAKKTVKGVFKPVSIFLISDLLLCIVLTGWSLKMLFWVIWANIYIGIIYGSYLVISCLRKYMRER